MKKSYQATEKCCFFKICFKSVSAKYFYQIIFLFEYGTALENILLFNEFKCEKIPLR